MNSIIRSTSIGVVLCSAIAGCSLNRPQTLAPAKAAELWVNPTDLEQRDLFNGPGGARNAPDPQSRFTIKGKKTTGTQSGYDVKDERGREWSAKLGVESRVEVAVSRLVWAIGYHQPDIYYMRAWTVAGPGADRVEEPARMRLEPEGGGKSGQWSWGKNPFIGTRELAGLFVMMVMVNNWDLKKAQNPFFESDKAPTRYMVRDLGASFGKTAWIRMATKDDADDFDAERFIAGVEGNRVRFHYAGGWLEPRVLSTVTPDDVRWLCALLARISPEQMSDAFRAGGFTEPEGARYARRLRAKIAEGLALQ